MLPLEELGMQLLEIVQYLARAYWDVEAFCLLITITGLSPFQIINMMSLSQATLENIPVFSSCNYSTNTRRIWNT